METAGRNENGRGARTPLGEDRDGPGEGRGRGRGRGRTGGGARTGTCQARGEDVRRTHEGDGRGERVPRADRPSLVSSRMSSSLTGPQGRVSTVRVSQGAQVVRDPSVPRWPDSRRGAGRLGGQSWWQERRAGATRPRFLCRPRRRRRAVFTFRAADSHGSARSRFHRGTRVAGLLTKKRTLPVARLAASGGPESNLS